MAAKKKYILLTNDVETTSILNNCLSDKTGEKVLKEGMPLLLDLYARYGIKSTFFFTGYIAEKFPDVVKMILPYGHEVASHGYSHEVDQCFDVLSYPEQTEHLRRSKDILETISGREIISFRAPAARVNRDTPAALIGTGFKIDSSVAPQRFDMFLSFGGIKKLNWLTAPRLPYLTQENNLWKKGPGPVLEIPISALLMPYIGTTLRIFPHTTAGLRRILHAENAVNGKPVVFLTHPNEFIDEELVEVKTLRRSSNFISYLLGDVVRRKLKMRNLGSKALPLYEKEIRFFHSRGYEFVTCREYYELHNPLNTK
ncbi:MAG: polysaccharide deacetylase family protein [Bacteroidales bacterium]|nr:polysaccharide deacetylase family protein [Bacteroidales bacterium]